MIPAGRNTTLETVKSSDLARLETTARPLPESLLCTGEVDLLGGVADEGEAR